MADTERRAWADEDVEDGLPPPQVTVNPDNTKTVVSYRLNDDGKKVRITQKIRETRVKATVDHAVAERKKWAKYGLESGSGSGPQLITTKLDDNIVLKLGLKSAKSDDQKVEEDTAEKIAKEAAGGKKFVCRTCGGEHFTSRCPYKDALGNADSAGDEVEAGATRFGTPQPEVGGGAGGGGYVPPHLRNRPPGTVLSDPGRTPTGERDDSATLRVTNLSEDIVEDELRHLFGRFGRIVRCHLVRDRETGRNRGFAFVSYETRDIAAFACQKLHGFALDNLIMHVEFSKKQE